jgi:hypothetical protein
LGPIARINWLALLAAAPAALLAWQVHLTCGLVYSIDDPYIHLALARQILSGHYGINPGEFSAPSSSILWPFLLAPFTFTRLSEFLPLALNLVAVLVTVWWLQRWLAGYMEPAWALLATTALALLLNLYGLALTGMENSWQVTFTVVIALSLARDRVGGSFWIAVVLLPLIRYEGLAISLPALAYMLPTERNKAIVNGAIVALVVAGFSLFLYTNGVGFLPSSVLAKNGIGFMADLSRSTAFLDNVATHAFFVALALAAAVLYLGEGKTREALLLVLAPVLLHLLFGRYGWFGRYHIYIAVWILILFGTVYMRSPLRHPLISVVLALALVAVSIDSVKVTLTTAAGARNVHDQQRQMGILLRDHLDEPVAVNDLGFTSLYARRYILDLGGLASYDALKFRADPKAGDWIGPLMAVRKVEHAMVYDSWIPTRPANWVHVATLHLPPPWVSVGGDKVAFYSTSPEAAERFRKALSDYRQASPLAALTLVLEP